MSAEVYPVAHPVGIQGNKGFLPVFPFHSGTKGGFSSRSNTTAKSLVL